MRQVALRKDENTWTYGWVENVAGLKPGALITLKDPFMEGLWHVVSVGDTILDKEEVDRRRTWRVGGLT